jgi:large subunit ribosomal protein L3
MAKGILGTKIGMTQIFVEDGTVVPVTIVQAGPCVVVDKATPERNQYSAIKVGFQEVLEKRLSKAEAGVFKKAGVASFRTVREFRVDAKEAESVAVGGEIKVDIFRRGQFVDVTGITKGRGFQGVVRRWNMKGAARDSASTHEHHRHIGAIGQRKTPGKVWKGKHLPGHYGVERVTIQNLQIVEVDVENQLLLIRGGIPGHKNSLVEINPCVKGRPDRPVVHVEQGEAEDKKKGKK